MLKDKVGELTVRYVQGRGRFIEVLAQFGDDLLGYGTIARRCNDPLPTSEMADHRAQRSVRQNEIGIEENLPMLSHRETKIAERAMQGIGQCHSVLVFRHD